MPKLLATTYYSMKGCVRPSVPLQKIKSFVTRQAETIRVTTFSCKTCTKTFIESGKLKAHESRIKTIFIQNLWKVFQ